MNIRRPLKAPTTPVQDFASLQYHLPLYASDKEDGIRCLLHPTLGPVSQRMLPIPNEYIRNNLHHLPPCLDGELITYDKNGAPDDFHTIQSKVMSRQGTPDFVFWVFDWFGNIYEPYKERLRILREDIASENIYLLKQTLCHTIAELQVQEEQALQRGKEGLMLRHPQGWYKEGRSTFNEAYLLKVKRFTDDEAVVLSVEEEQQNCNDATSEISGLLRRSKHQANMRGKSRVGALICEWRERQIRVASGINGHLKKTWWDEPSQIIGRTITFRYQAHGTQILPRCPVFKGVRLDTRHLTLDT